MGSGTKWPWQRGCASVVGEGGFLSMSQTTGQLQSSPRQQEPEFLWDGCYVWIQEQWLLLTHGDLATNTAKRPTADSRNQYPASSLHRSLGGSVCTQLMTQDHSEWVCYHWNRHSEYGCAFPAHKASTKTAIQKCTESHFHRHGSPHSVLLMEEIISQEMMWDNGLMFMEFTGLTSARPTRLVTRF